MKPSRVNPRKVATTYALCPLDVPVTTLRDRVMVVTIEGDLER